MIGVLFHSLIKPIHGLHHKLCVFVPSCMTIVRYPHHALIYKYQQYKTPSEFMPEYNQVNFICCVSFILSFDKDQLGCHIKQCMFCIRAKERILSFVNGWNVNWLFLIELNICQLICCKYSQHCTCKTFINFNYPPSTMFSLLPPTSCLCRIVN